MQTVTGIKSNVSPTARLNARGFAMAFAMDHKSSRAMERPRTIDTKYGNAGLMAAESCGRNNAARHPSANIRRAFWPSQNKSGFKVFDKVSWPDQGEVLGNLETLWVCGKGKL